MNRVKGAPINAWVIKKYRITKKGKARIEFTFALATLMNKTNVPNKKKNKLGGIGNPLCIEKLEIGIINQNPR